MKEVPRKFRAQYRNNDSESEEGFEPFVDNEGNRHFQRIVEIEPFSDALEIKMYDLVVDLVSHRYFHQQITIWRIYASNAALLASNSRRKFLESTKVIIPTLAQAEMIYALACGNVQGRYAETLVNKLYLELIVGNDEVSEFSKYLPEVKAWYDRISTLSTGSFDKEKVADRSNE